MADDAPLVPHYRDLVIPGAHEKLDDLAHQVEEMLVRPWSRDLQTEQSRTLRHGEYRVFRREEGSSGPGLLLFLMVQGDDVVVANVVPTGDVRELTKDQYNSAVEEFHRLYLDHAARLVGFDTRLEATHLDLSTVLDESTFRALLGFSRAANRSTGSSHPLDRGRWFDFILGVHRSGAHLSTGDLQDWLVLDGWSEDVAIDLIIEFEFGLGLLQHADRR